MSDFFTRLGKKIDAFLSIPKLLQSIREEIQNMREEIQTQFDELRAEVEAVKSNEAAAATLLQGLHDQLDQALNSSDDPTEIVNAIQGITSQLKQDTDALAAAVAANSNSPGGQPSSGDVTGSGSDVGSGTGSDTGSGTGSDVGGDAGSGSAEAGNGDGTSGDAGGDAGSGDAGSGDATDPTA